MDSEQISLLQQIFNKIKSQDSQRVFDEARLTETLEYMLKISEDYDYYKSEVEYYERKVEELEEEIEELEYKLAKE